ncbi:protein bark beetle-like [Anneissia japonica]|uniref:protein bark beetle-like n=1 Tax=Anneissia japonica TaxID=1529436 RepID=UPI00142594CF|nr:protein bark beetle-like [Anneissia japonica]
MAISKHHLVYIMIVGICCSNLTLAETFINGEISEDTNWLSANSPVYVTDDITVGTNVTVTIQAGVQMLFAEGVGIYVKGTLITNGTEDEHVVMTSFGNPTFSREDWHHKWSHVRLVSGSNHLEGRVLVYMNGRWGKVCVSSQNYVNVALVVCRQLGYEGGFYRWFGSGEEPIHFNIIHCELSEKNIFDCFNRRYTYNDDCYGNVFGIVCRQPITPIQNVTLPINPFWTGLKWLNDGIHETHSVLKYTDISLAGVDANGEAGNPAIYANLTGELPSLSNVNILDCAGSGIRFSSIASNINIKDVVVRSNLGYGIEMSTLGLISIINSEFNENTFDGIAIFNVDYSSLRLEDLCNDESDDLFIDAFEHRYMFKSSANYYNQPCQRTFYTKEGYILKVRFVQHDGWPIRINLYDGNDTSTFIQSVTSLQVQDLKSMSNIITIRHECSYYNYNSNCRRNSKLIIWSEPMITSNASNEISYTTLADNKGNGLTIHTYMSELNINDLTAIYNRGNGLQTHDRIHDLVVELSNFSGNSFNGIDMYNIVNMFINASSANGNEMNGMISGKYTYLTLQNSVFDSNLENGFFINEERYNDYSYSYNLHLDSNSFSYNKGSGIFRKEYRQHVNVYIHGNSIRYNQNGAIDFGTIRSRGIKVVENDISLNVAYYLIHIDVTYSYVGEAIKIVSNVFLKNSCERLLYLGTSSSSQKIIIEENVMKNNQPRLRFPNSFWPSSVIFLLSSSVSMISNIFDNSNFMYEVAVPGRDKLSSVSINASLSWWGSTNCSFINTRILDGKRRASYPVVHISPYRVGYNLSDLDYQSCVQLGFRNDPGSTIGGSITGNVTLSSVDNPYRVVHDIVIQPQAILVVEAGVKLLFDFYTGILVHGTLVAQGNTTDVIRMEPFDRFNETIELIRLSGGRYPWEGFLEVSRDGQWGSVCYFSYNWRIPWNAIAARIACRQLGYIDYISYTYRTSTLLNILNAFKCDERIHTNIVYCGFKNPLYRCSSGHTVYLTCNPGRWQGIRFAVSPERSSMSHTHISLTGGYLEDMNVYADAAIQVDLHHHYFSNVHLHNAHQGFIFYIDNPIFNVHSVMNTHINSLGTGVSIYSPSYYHYQGIIECATGIYISTMSSTHLDDIRNYIHKSWVLDFFESDQSIFFSDLFLLNILPPEETYNTHTRNFTVQPGNIIAIYIYQQYLYSYESLVLTDPSNGETLLLLDSTISGTFPDYQLVQTSSNFLTVTYKYTYRYSTNYARIKADILLMPLNESSAGAEQSNGNANTIILDSINYIPQSIRPTGLRMQSGTTKSELRVINSNFQGSERSGTLVSLYNGRRVLFERCNMSSAQYAVRIRGEFETISFRGCILKYISNGIYDYNSFTSATLNIEDCTFNSISTPIYKYVRSIDQSTRVYRSSFKDSYYGVRFYQSVHNILLDGCNFQSVSYGVHIYTRYYHSYNNNASVYLHDIGFQSVRDPVYVEMYVTDNSPSTKEWIDLRVSDCVVEGSDVFLETYIFTETVNIKVSVMNNRVIYSKKAILMTVNRNVIGNLEYMVNIVNNTISNNTGYGAIIDIGRPREYPVLMTDLVQVDFRNNVIRHNVITSKHFLDKFSCGLILGVRTATLSGNVFDNIEIDMEICSAHVFNDPDHFIDARSNRWGTTEHTVIRQKIFDNEDWHNLAYIMTKSNDQNTISDKCSSSNIGGRINATCHLEVANSPYVVESDITILPNAELIIDPGVTLLLNEDNGITILGKLTAIGTISSRITLLNNNNLINAKDKDKIRLIQGNSRVQGLLQVFTDGEWKSVKTYYFGHDEGAVACRQLGYSYERYTSSTTDRNFKSYLSRRWYCRGHEFRLLDCQNYNDYNYYWYSDVWLVCKSSNWGNIQVYTDSDSEISAIQYVDVLNAGKLHGLDGVPAIYAFGPQIPLIENIYTENCIGHAILIDSTTALTITRITLIQCGLGISSRIYSATNVHECYFDDIYTTGLSLTTRIASFFPSQSLFYTQGCGTHRFVNPGDQFVLRDNACGEINCINVFQCRQNCTIFVTFTHYYSYNRYSRTAYVYDGNSTDSTRIGEINYYRAETLTFMATSNAVTLELNYFTTSYGNCRFDYEPVEIHLSVYDKEYLLKSSITIEDSNFINVMGSVVSIVDDYIDETIPVDVSISKSTFQSCSQTSNKIMSQRNGNCSITENLFVGNYGDVAIHGISTDSIVTIAHNYFLSNTEGGVLSVKSEFSPIWITGNQFYYNKPSANNDVVTIMGGNTCVTNNVFCYNHGRHLIFVLGDINYGSRLIERNIMIYNTGQRSDERFTMLLDNINTNISRNYILNAGNEFEVALTSRVKSTVDATYNWWGADDIFYVKSRVRDSKNIIGHAFIQQEPFFTSPSEVPFYSSLCPPAYTLEGSKCYSYKPASVDFSTAMLICRLEGNTIYQLANFFCPNCIFRYRGSDVKDLKRYLIMKNGGYFETSRIWIMNRFQTNKCSYLELDYGSGKHITGTTDCKERYPTVCERTTKNLCPNNCMGNGMCWGRRCRCDPGWSGKDCSQHICSYGCSIHGTCVGPNVCRCKSGWQGSSCTSSYCRRFKNCRSCAKVEGCGWCDSTLKCLPGTSTGPELGVQCEAWFHNYCFTTGTCSNSIEILNCKLTHCDTTRSSTTIGSCQSCRDLEQCFIEKPNGCNVWSPDMCPLNLVNPNYADPNRKNNIEIDEKVQVINVGQNSANLYICPVKRNDEVLLISSRLLKKTEASNILVSGQAQGVFHTVVSIKHLWRHSMIMARVARFDEVFQYANLNDVLDVIEITDYSDLPEESFWNDAINTPLSYPMKDIVLLQDVPFNKCSGSIHVLGTRKYHSTFIVLTPDIANSYNIEVGDILAVNSTGHFIEAVAEIGEESDSTFIETSVLDCNDETIRNRVMLTPPSSVLHENANIIFGCSGGENNTDGIVLIDKNIDEPLQIDTSTLIIGRETSGLVGKVLHYEVRGYNAFIEVLVARDHQEFNDILNEGNDDDINNNDSPLDLRLSKPTIYNDDDISCEIDPQFQFNPSLRLIFSTDRIKYKQLDVIYEGPIETGLHINCSAGVPFDTDIARRFAVNRRNGNFYISLGGLKIPLSVGLTSKYSIIAGLPASLETKFGVTSTAELNIGYGIRPQEKRPVVLTPVVCI